MPPNELVVANNFEEIRAIRPWLEIVLSPLESERVASAIGGIELAIHEIATNSIDHANSSVDELKFSAELHGDSVTILVTDHGDSYVEHELPSLEDEPRVRGYGLLIVEQLATSLQHDRVDDTNVWSATFAL